MARGAAMFIDEEKYLATIWYENNKGDRYVPELKDIGERPPSGVKYYHSLFPLEVTERVYRLVTEDDVKNCQHKDIENLSFSRITGMDSRRCRSCYGKQSKRRSEDWPDEWEARGMCKIYSARATYSEDLVAAMISPSLKQRIKSFFRNNYKLPKKYRLSDAIMILVNCCERCSNYLCYKYGLDVGYPERSEKWHKAKTVCKFCEHMDDVKKFKRSKTK